MNKPFCFRCGGVPKYQVTLKTPDETLGIWPLCEACFTLVPWGEILNDTIQEEERRKAARHD